MFKYLRYCIMFPLLALSVIGLAMGGPWMWMGLTVSLFVVVVGDELLSADPTLPSYSHPEFLNLFMFCTLPFIAAMFALLIWMCAPSSDPLHLAALVKWLSGWDMLAARDQTRTVHLVGGVLTTVLLTGIGGINMAHEMMHRSHPLMRLWSRTLQVFSFDVPGNIAHLNAHHVRVGLPDDPSTGHRGESAYAFVFRAIVMGNLYGWKVEVARLQRLGKGPLNWQNKFLQGHALSVLATALAYFMSGWIGTVVFVCTAVLSKSLLELVNYIQHYGLVRLEGAAIGIRHSWNSNKRISTYLLCNVTRHSYHHVEPALPFWLIEPAPNAPTLSFGYLTCVLLTLVPPLWHRIMSSKLQEWDAVHATPEERALAQAANLRSGISRLAVSD